MKALFDHYCDLLDKAGETGDIPECILGWEPTDQYVMINVDDEIGCTKDCVEVLYCLIQLHISLQHVRIF